MKITAQRQPWGQVIQITDEPRDFQMGASLDETPREAIQRLAREYRYKAEKARNLAAFLEEAAATLEPTQ